MYNCDECGGQLTTNKDGLFVCTSCGTVSDEPNLVGVFNKEERDFVNIMKTNNYGSNIKDIKYDTKGKKLTKDKQYKMRRMMWNNRSTKYKGKTRNLSIALAHIKRITSMMSLPRQTQDSTSYIYRHALDSKIRYGKIISLVIASIYVACRQHQHPYGVEDIAALVNEQVSIRKINKIVNEISKTMKNLPPPNILSYITRFGNELKLSDEIIRRAYRTFNVVNEKSNVTSGKKPETIALAILTIASELENNKLTYDDLKTISSISTNTIMTRKKEIIKKVGKPLLLDDISKLKRQPQWVKKLIFG